MRVPMGTTNKPDRTRAKCALLSSRHVHLGLDSIESRRQPDEWIAGLTDRPDDSRGRFAQSVYDGQAVLVTGGTGSFGRKFVRTLLERTGVKRLIVFSRDELKQLEMSETLSHLDKNGALRFFIGDVRDEKRLSMALRGIDLVVHAAALKQVPAAEYNPFECIHTNVLGAENVVNASLTRGVKKVIALSTDKAASPINLYGASKLASDKIFVAANHLAGAEGTRFSVVRYGNVLGSRGSVVPYFRKLVASGADHLPITDARMTRFWITLQQGVDFVSNCMASMRGGEILVPKIPSMKVVDVAEAVAPNLPHRIVGIRPGEKLHEVMITEDDARHTLDCGSHYAIRPSIALWGASEQALTGKAVAENFRYSSDGNQQWLNIEQMKALIEQSLL